MLGVVRRWDLARAEAEDALYKAAIDPRLRDDTPLEAVFAVAGTLVSSERTPLAVA